MPHSETITRLFEKLDEQTKILHEVDKNVTSLNEKSANYNERLHNLEILNKDFITRIESLENRMGVMTCNCSNSKEKIDKIEFLEQDITKIKRDRWWVGAISGFVGWLIGLVAGLIGLFK